MQPVRVYWVDAVPSGIGPLFVHNPRHNRLMPGLDYPFVFECSNCDEETIVERADVLDMHPDPDSFEAIHLTLENRSWLRDELDHMIWCPDCIRGGSDGKATTAPVSNAFSER